MKRRRTAILLALALLAVVTTEYLARRRVDPTGRVATLTQYLAWRTTADQFATVTVNGQPHVIAYGPGSGLILLPSGPSACVFDNTGRLVDWSSDIGDDPRFDAKWSAQRARGTSLLPRTQIQTLASTQPAR